jgi:4-alpha-glucanotransferase
MKFKISALKELYDVQKNDLKTDSNYHEFINLNRDWLAPYAAFSFLRDKYGTPDFLLWKKHSQYDAQAIQKLVSPSSSHYHKIAFYYFVQYHLHLQMKEVSEYAHKKRVVLKGDIPIGIYRYGCDAWVNPSLYNMDEQAGAPPDDFAVKGQNWGFPTYNWERMKEDNFEWWRKRFNQMSNYFDAFRIDHILGFFRIWSIPMDAVEGILGKFVPAIPIDISEFNSNGIWFDYNRYCSPFITDELLQQAFGDRAQEIKNEFLEYRDERWILKDVVNTQQKVLQHLGENPDEKLKQGLFDLISNVILIEEKNSNGQKFHFRIAMDRTFSFSQLEQGTQQQLKDLYINYFYRRQDDFWRHQALKKLPALKRSTNMLVCGEDLGMVPHCVPQVMGQLGILSLEIERMPKDSSKEFFHPNDAPYLSVVTPSTHDMSTIRGWWEEDREKTQKFYNFMLGHYGIAPYFCEGWINKEIILQHLYSPAMLSIFQLQDLLGINEELRRDNPQDERINIPSEPNHYWHYRMHLTLESLLQENEFNHEINQYIIESGRGEA